MLNHFPLFYCFKLLKNRKKFPTQTMTIQMSPKENQSQINNTLNPIQTLQKFKFHRTTYPNLREKGRMMNNKKNSKNWEIPIRVNKNQRRPTYLISLKSIKNRFLLPLSTQNMSSKFKPREKSKPP